MCVLTGMVRLFGRHGAGCTDILWRVDDSEWHVYWKVWHVSVMAISAPEAEVLDSTLTSNVLTF